jgi:glycosyltransferase involved in cell wall biosynthesis
MKIIYLHQYFKFPNESGGTRSFDLAMGFLASQHSVEIVTTTSNEKYKTFKRWVRIEQNGLVVNYIYLPYGNHFPYLQRTFVFFQFLWFSTFKLMSLNGDVVLATSTPLTIGIPALLKKWKDKTPFVFEVRDVWPEAVIAIGVLKNKILQRLLYKLEALIYKNAEAIVPLSSDMKYSILTRYPKLINKPIIVIENISEINRFQNGYNKEVKILKRKIGFQPRFSILYAGTFGKVNGIGYVLSLAEKLFFLDTSIVFILVGEGAEKKVIEQEAIAKGVFNKNVFILDVVSKQDLPQLYYECSMGSSFVIPIQELWANSANKFFDTLAAGRPILINYKGWQKDVIINEKIGYVLPSILNDKSIKEFILYTKNEISYTIQKKNTLTVAKDFYSLEVALSKYEEVFKILK